jgi:hypothetical protein
MNRVPPRRGIGVVRAGSLRSGPRAFRLSAKRDKRPCLLAIAGKTSSGEFPCLAAPMRNTGMGWDAWGFLAFLRASCPAHK